jgi:hypothetical protein
MSGESKKPVLHEILSVEAGLESKAKTLIQGAITTFKNRVDSFKGSLRITEMFGKTEANAAELSAIEEADKQEILVVDSVPNSLNYFLSSVAEWYDILYCKEMGNQQAKASVEINGVVIVENAPVGFLMAMEKRLVELRGVFLECPTLDASVSWVLDDTYSIPHVYVSPETAGVKTAKSTIPVILYQATDKHPAQVKEQEVTKNVGKILKKSWSGMIYPSQKAGIVDRLDALIRAFKEARQRANGIAVDKVNVSTNIMKYLLGNWYNPEKRNTADTQATK